MHRYIGLTLLAISLMSTPVQAQIQFIPPQKFPNAYANYGWGRQEPGYHGCPCGCRRSKLVAVVPNNSPALTVSSHPGFFVNLPKIEKQYIESPDKKLEAEFSLMVNKSDEIIYQTEIPISDEGINEIKLPSSFPGLETGKDYLWGLTIFCRVDDNPIYVSGIVRRVEPSAKLASQLKQADPLQTAVIYAKNGIWVEAISTLAQLRRESPQNLRVMDYWRSLLKSVVLEDISQQPLLK